MTLDILIIKGLVYDGTGTSPVEIPVGIKGERLILPPHEVEATQIIDAHGLAIAPGFIDTHGHSEFTVLTDPRQEGKLYQGITTEINGNCGLSAAPLYGEYFSHRLDDLKEYEIPYRWNTLEQYLTLLERIRPSINFVTLAGHGNIRGSVRGFKKGTPSSTELSRMKALLKEALQEGAVGLSTGLIYPPGIYANTDELIELTSAGVDFSQSREIPFVYTSHIRSESERLIESIEEVINIAVASNSPVHISHIKTAGKENWHKIDRALGLIREAHTKGIRLSADRYPYTASSTDLDSILPSWVFEGGKEKELERLKEADSRIRIKEVLSGINYLEDIVISSVVSPSNKWMEGENLKQIAQRLKKEAGDTLIDLLIEEGLRVRALFHSMSEENLERFLKEPYMMVGTDSSSRCFDGPTATGKPHPRGFGSMPRFLGRYVREKKIMSLEEAIRRITYLPAKTFGIVDRGVIKDHVWADLVIFDPNKLIDRADFSMPFLRPEGIRYVFVNGLCSIKEGKPTGIRNGKVLRHGR